MAMLVIAIAVTFPSLQAFFRGRALESEGRRFLTLTRYAQSRAVAEGIPMTLWIDAHEGAYGLEAQNGYLDRDDKAVDYDLDERLEIEVTQSSINRAQMTQEQQMRRRNQATRRNALPEILFTPDGAIDLTSPQTICIREDKENALWITQTPDRLGYEVQNNEPDRRR